MLSREEEAVGCKVPEERIFVDRLITPEFVTYGIDKINPT